MNKCTLKDDFWSSFTESENQLNTLEKKRVFLYGFVHVWYFVKGVKGLSMPHYFCTSIVNICIVFSDICFVYTSHVEMMVWLWTLHQQH